MSETTAADLRQVHLTVPPLQFGRPPAPTIADTDTGELLARVPAELRQLT